MARRLTLLEIWIESKGIWAGIVRMLGYAPARRKGLSDENSLEIKTCSTARGLWPSTMAERAQPHIERENAALRRFLDQK